MSPPTLSKTFGWISPEAMSVSRSPEDAANPEYPSPVAVLNAGAATFSLRNVSEDAYATLAVPVAAGALEPEPAAGELAPAAGELELEVAAELDELLHPAAASPVHVMASRATTGAFLLAETRIIYRTLPLIVA